LSNTQAQIAIVASSSNNHASVYPGLVQGTLSHLSEAFANVTKALEQILGGNQVSHRRGDAPATNHLLALLPPAVTEFIYSRTPFENTSIALAISALLILTMSWASRFGNLGRFSPFAREPPKGPSTVSDADFSYITSDDLRRFDESQHNEDLGPARNTDVLKFQNSGKSHEVHFPAYSIAKGELTVGGIRDHAAKKIGVSDSQRVKLLVKGRTLLDDSQTAKQAGLRHDDSIFCVASEGAGSDSDDDDDGDEDSSALDGEGTTKKKRNRGKKTKRRNKREAQNAPAVAAPTTAIGKLDALRAVLETFIPQCQAFEASPPADPAKRSYEHKRLSETILTQVLLKTDAVETEGDAEARARRKELVRETQELLTRLDQVEKS
jgi:hypothetical protein